MLQIKQKIVVYGGTRAVMYRTINAGLGLQLVYSAMNYIAEQKRITFTGFRLSSHRLRIYMRMGREDRLCECGSVQDESHVLFNLRPIDLCTIFPENLCDGEPNFLGVNVGY